MTGPMIQNTGQNFTMTAASAGGTAKVYCLLITVSSTTEYVNGTSVGSFGPYTSYLLMQIADYNIVRNYPQIASIDSRTVYGQPDLAGEQPGDPNAPARAVNFYGWQYKGGLFSGNTLGSSDESGTARIEAYVPGTSFVDPIWSDTVLTYLGHNANFTTDITYNIAFPATTDPNLAYVPDPVGNQYAATWTTAWNLANATTYTAISTANMTSGQYVNFQAAGFVPEVILALQNEATIVSSNQTAWAYFATPGWATASGQMNATDATPRIWVVDLTGHNP
jgi:hypothetical protein